MIESQFRRGEDEGVANASERQVLRAIWRNTGISRSEITSHVDLSQQSVHRILDLLIERGLVALGPPKPARGQPSPTLKLDGGYTYSCGVSLNTDVVGICLMDLAGRRLADSHIALNDCTVADALKLINADIQVQQARLALDPARFFGVGFAIAGYNVGGTSFNAPLPLHEWSLIELEPLLTDFFRKPVWVYNSANAGAIAEAMFGVGRHIKNFAYLSFNYGFGGGLIAEGELFSGGHGNAAKFSSMFDDDEHQRRPALQFLMQRLKENGIDIPSIEYMRRHFDIGWPGVSEWVAEVEPAYNRLINAVSAIADPQAIVFGGQVPLALAQMFIDATRIYGRPRYGVPVPRAKLVISELKGDAPAQGAAVLPFRREFF